MVILLCLFLCISFFRFIGSINQLNTNTILEHLEDIGKETVNNYNYQFNEYLSVIDHIASSVGQMNINEKEIDNFLNSSLQEYSAIERIWFVDKQKIFHANENNQEYKYDLKKIHNTFNGKHGFSNPIISPLTQENVIIIYSPVLKNNNLIGGICGVIKLNKENNSNIYNDVFQDETYVFMISNDGNIISKIKNSNMLYNGDNYLDFLKNDVQFTENKYENVLSMINHNESGYIAYNCNGAERIAYCTPAKINDWYICSVISSDVITQMNGKVQDVTLTLILKLVIIFLITTFIIVKYFIKIDKEHVEMAKRVMTTNRKIELILKQTSERIFEYNIEGDSLTLDAWNNYPKTIFNHFLGNLHNYGFVSRQHENLLKSKFKEISEKKESLSFDAILPYIHKNDKIWYHINLSYVAENNTVIGTLRNSTEEMNEYNLLLQDQMFKNSIYSHAYFMFAVNLKSKKVLVYQELGEYHNVIDISYDEFLKNLILRVDEDDRIKAQNFFDFQHILNIYNNHERNTIDFRFFNQNTQTYEWFCLNVEFERQSSNNELLMIAYFVDINEKKSQQLEYEFRATRDGLTGLYNRQTYQKLVDEYLEKKNSVSDYCAYLICDLDNFKSINDTLGHSFGDAVIKEVAHVLESEAMNSAYACRYGGDEFMVFYYNQESYAQIEMKTQNILKKISEIRINKLNQCSASVGIKFVENEKTYKQLFDKSDKALYVSKKNGKGIYTVWKDSIEENTGL